MIIKHFLNLPVAKKKLQEMIVSGCGFRMNV